MRKVSTPWGLADQSSQIADGIIFHSTPSHGGFELSSERNESLQRKFKFNTFAGGKWYEEDCDACAVVIAFPTCFSTQKVMRAVKSAEHFKTWEVNDGKQGGNWHRVVAFCERDKTLRALMEQETAVLAAE
jgi:hypothetical protein